MLLCRSPSMEGFLEQDVSALPSSMSNISLFKISYYWGEVFSRSLASHACLSGPLFVTSGIWLAQGFPVAHVHWQCDPALAEQFCWNGFPIACNGRSTVPMQAASQNALSWKWPTRIIESTLYVNGPYGDWTHNLGVLSTMLWPTEPICENWQEMHVHPKFLKGEVAVALGNVKATEKPGMRD